MNPNPNYTKGTKKAQRGTKKYNGVLRAALEVSMTDVHECEIVGVQKITERYGQA